METSVPTTNPSEHLPDRIKWDASFDAVKLQQEILALFPYLPQREYIYYNVVPLRGSVRQRKATGEGEIDFSDPNLFEWGDTPLMDYCPYIKEIVQFFKTDATNVRLMRLEAGAEVKEHRDPTLDASFRTVIRLTVPIFSNDNVTFLLNDVPVPMQPGEVWYMRLSDRHAVFNNNAEERINLSIDLVYNEWLEEKLLSLASAASCE